MSGFTSGLKKRVLERDGGFCVICGTNYGIDVHHRAGRGAGGSKLANVLSNLMVACRRHNNLMETDSAFMREAYLRGWKVRRHGVRSPEDVAVWYPLEEAWCLLGDDGARVRLAPEQLDRYLPDEAENNEGP